MKILLCNNHYALLTEFSPQLSGLSLLRNETNFCGAKIEITNNDMLCYAHQKEQNANQRKD